MKLKVKVSVTIRKDILFEIKELAGNDNMPLSTYINNILKKHLIAKKEN